jgi:hypothetical protein
LDDAYWFDTQDSDRDDALVISPYLCHADLFADDRFLCHGGNPFLVLLLHANAPTTSLLTEHLSGFCRVVPLGISASRPSRTSIVFSTIDLAHRAEAQIAWTGNTIGGKAEPQRVQGQIFTPQGQSLARLERALFV